MPNIGLPELLIVLVIALVVFGPKRLPDMGRQLGKTLREFKDATSEIRSQIGVDDIADSVKDIKSGLSLTSTDASSSNGPVAAEPPASAVPEIAPASAAPVTETPAAQTYHNGPVAAGAPAPAQETPAAQTYGNGPVAAGAPAPASAPDDGASATGGFDGGVETFGKLTRSSASSSARTTAD